MKIAASRTCCLRANNSTAAYRSRTACAKIITARCPERHDETSRQTRVPGSMSDDVKRNKTSNEAYYSTETECVDYLLTVRNYVVVSETSSCVCTFEDLRYRRTRQCRYSRTQTRRLRTGGRGRRGRTKTIPVRSAFCYIHLHNENRNE